MTDAPLSVLNARTAVAAVRAADRVGLDAEQLLDSAQLHSRLAALDADDPGFPRQVSELVQEHAASRGLTAAAPAQPAAQSPAGDAATEAAGERQWTLDDVNRSTPQECVTAAEQGLLRDLGYPPPKRRRGIRR